MRRALAAGGVDAVYGSVLDGLGVTLVRPAVAPLFAAAHERLTGRRAAVHLVDGALVVGTAGAAGADGTFHVSTLADLAQLPSVLESSPACTVHLDLALDRPAGENTPIEPAAVSSWEDVDPAVAAAVEASHRTVVLAGPGALTTAGIRGTHALAAAGRLGVVNTWGAKGLFDWRSRHHWATAGLQARDVELAGLADADLVIATGLDPDESPVDRWTDLAPVLPVAPAQLGALAEVVRPATGPLEYPPLRDRLSAVSQRGWASEARPLAPAKATRHYAAVLGRGVLGADAGLAGYWVARTFATVEPRLVHVPGRDAPGAGLACAVVAKLLDPHRAALAVADGPLHPAAEAVLDEAARLGVGLGVELWDPAGDELGPEDHLERCRMLATAERLVIARLRTDDAPLAEMIEVAGPVTAWLHEVLC